MNELNLQNQIPAPTLPNQTKDLEEIIKDTYFNYNLTLFDKISEKSKFKILHRITYQTKIPKMMEKLSLEQKYELNLMIELNQLGPMFIETLSAMEGGQFNLTLRKLKKLHNLD